jgi:hypothetical protein
VRAKEKENDTKAWRRSTGKENEIIAAGGSEKKNAVREGWRRETNHTL